ncbi:MAG: hypothetical protein HBSAPP03_10200 [Phycisphaerae bacterium]|nr:MAG: hypothetical protein HBSAPP03_10200 [Phycisphaerae bacterium]
MRLQVLAAVLGCGAFGAGVAKAGDTVEIESSFSGGIWSTGVTAPHFMNYFVGYSIPSTPVERRNYFLFSLADVSAEVTGARLKLFLPGGPSLPSGYVSSDPTETYRVSGSPAPWTAFYDAYSGTATPAMLSAMFGTMGALGPTTYGLTVVSGDDSGTDIILELSPAAIADINAALGSMFVVTGRLTDLHLDAPGTPPSELVFAYTDIPHPLMPMPRLELDVVPAPAGVLTLATGLLLAGRRRRD